MTDTVALPAFPFGTPPDVDTDPEALRLLAAGPVARARMGDGQQVWLALSHAANRLVMGDPRLSRAQAMRPGGAVTMPVAVGVTDVITNMDPPEHTRVRRLVAGAFTARRIDQLQPRIQSIVDDLLADMAAAGEPADLIERLAAPLPITVICELVGVPPADRDRLRGWLETFMAAQLSPDERAAVFANVAALLTDLIAAKRAEPGDDLTTALTRVHDEDGDRLSEQEIVINVQTVMTGGYETTANRLANGIVALSRHPDQFDLLRATPQLAGQAVEELLRWDKNTTGALPKIALEDIEVDGHVIPAGAIVIAMAHIANRDPAVFTEPNRFDIRRPNNNQHLSFAHGAHFCLGAHLARTVLRTALESLMRRFPTLRLAVADTELRWKQGRISRALRELPVTW
jgi:cytochrome P450